MRRSDHVLRRAQHAAKYHSLYISSHAELRMVQRGVQVRDLERAVLTAESAIPSGPRKDGAQRWRLVGGSDIDNDSLEAVVLLDSVDRTVVVTLF